MLLKILNKKSSQANQKSFIFKSSFTKIDSLLSPIKLFKYAPIISICFIKNPKSANMAKKIFSDLQYIMRANVLLKSIPSI